MSGLKPLIGALSMELHPQSGSNSQGRSVMVCSTPSGVVIVYCRGFPMNREFLQGFRFMVGFPL